ncbi:MULTISPECIES: gene transfer agent family protein [unclassified Mesorhizobium]|uniref:gene transfer agent family protein n=1 Tax=unclassified Mesorhizobium TaxID=325217 RepID=UPI0015E283B8|nr:MULTISPECIES: gene transfer agent family protein [unclassified Mesorhizobium]MBZ9999641.1 gene transfer agent family protein [Mesorhizobium sp. B264B2A]MCA0008115.1 gene transfer agent family protein [Mesorhizobium sp. B264B1B]MCA0018011.1 gene transfer agent family protein [Mesorhizobium sp. B264B1A]
MTDEPFLTYVDEFFGDAIHRFDVHSGGFQFLQELGEKLNEGPMVTFRKLYAGAWEVDTIRHVLRLGLVGGGTSPAEANKLMTRYFERSPLGEHAALALSIMAAAIVGRKSEDEPVPTAVEAVAVAAGVA